MPVKFSVGLKPLKTVPHLKTDYALQVQEQRCKQNISISTGALLTLEDDPFETCNT